MTTPAGSHTAGDTTGSGSAATEPKSFQGSREVEELKAFAILQEALALGASYANRPDRGNGRTKIKRGFEAVATLKAALARRSLPSPEAGGAETLPNRTVPGHPDAYLNALLDYAGGFYGAAIAAGMKASSAADAVKHVESAARGLHDLAERQASDLSTKDAENARLRGIVSAVLDEMRGDPSIETEDWQRLLARALNPTKGAGA